MRTRALVAAMLLTGCSGMKVAVDPLSIQDQGKYRSDLAQCGEVAKTYSLTGTTVTTGTIAGVAGGISVAGIAMAVAGGLFPPAIPFIVAGVVTAGAGGMGWSKSKEKDAREKIYAACMNERGYKAYAPQGGSHSAPAASTYQTASAPTAPLQSTTPSSPPVRTEAVAQASLTPAARTGPALDQTSPARMASANSSNINILLGPGWKTTASNIENLANFRIRATNAPIDAGLLIIGNRSADVDDLGRFSNAHIEKMVAALSNGTASELTKLKIHGFDALQGEVAGSEKKSGLKVRYLNTYVRGEVEIATISLWSAESAFPANRAEFETVLLGLRF